MNHTYVVSSTAIINGLSSSAFSGDFTRESSGGIAGLTNGIFAPITRDGGGAFDRGGFATGGNDGGTSVTYTFALTSIASIDVFTGWQDNGRDQQSFTVLGSPDGVTFTPITTVNFNPRVVGSSPIAIHTYISDSTGTLASKVVALRFNFNFTESGYSGYSEIDVFAVPEPSAALLGGLGLFCLLRHRRN